MLGVMMPVLDTVADRQAEWSTTANHLKVRIDRARWAVFILSVLGALLAAIASQMTTAAGQTLFGAPRTWIAILGAACLAAATFFAQRLLGAEHVGAWVRARAIAESLKREAYRFAAGAAPYDVAEAADATLDKARKEIEEAGDDLVGSLIPATEPGSLPRAPLSHDQYVDKRVTQQIDWYRRRAAGYRATN